MKKEAKDKHRVRFNGRVLCFYAPGHQEAVTMLAHGSGESPIHKSASSVANRAAQQLAKPRRDSNLRDESMRELIN